MSANVFSLAGIRGCFLRSSLIFFGIYAAFSLFLFILSRSCLLLSSVGEHSSALQIEQKYLMGNSFAFPLGKIVSCSILSGASG
jgi:hypothetical protein